MNVTVNGPLRVAIILFGLLAALSSGALALFTVGETYATVTAAVIVVASAIIAFTAPVVLGRVVLVMLIATLAGTVVTGAYGAIQVLAALAGSRSGPVDSPDPDELAAAERKIDQSNESTSFRVTLTESELNAVLLDSLAETDTPFQRITIDIVNSIGEPALIEFTGDFKNGRLSVNGEITARIHGGQVEVELLEADVGMFTMPGVAKDAVEDMIARVADLNRVLADEGADIQNVLIGDDQVSVAGVTTSDTPIDAAAMLTAFGNLGIPSSSNIDAPVYEPGVDAADADGSPLYIALGDSLAAAEGVPGFADGYVSQVHRQLSLNDGTVYGMRNLGIVGETSGTLLNQGQLDEAIAIGEDTDVAYVTIDIGANDLLGHLSSTDCSEDIAAPACTERIDLSLQAYAQNIDEILAKLRDSFPNATIILLQAYNPFSLGFEDRVQFEATSNEALAALNQIAADAAARYNVVVADGFSPMRGTTSATTHMTAVPPDIHPNELGYDILTGAILSALS